MAGRSEMARILWHGIGPWHKTAYGLQTSLFAPRLRDLGHEMVIAIMGEHGKRNPLQHPDADETRRTGLWDGMPVIGPGLTEFGLPAQKVIRKAFGGHDPDLIIVLKDAWVLDPEGYRRYPATAVWCNIDCEPMGAHDRAFFERSGTVPVATSRFGLSMMRKAGLENARYIPHGIDTGFWTPGDQDEARDFLYLPRGAFIAGINAANIGPRKAWPEQFKAFAYEHRNRRDSLLLVHAAAEHPEGISLRQLAFHLGLNQSPDGPSPDDAVRFGSHSNMTAAQMRSWYRSLDVLLAATYGEGFGVPIVEAHACGIPVIGTEGTAVSEKISTGTGWLVGGQEWWNPHHQAWWRIPNIRAISAKLGQPAAKPELIAQAAAPYDADLITAQHWKPLIEELCA